MATGVRRIKGGWQLRFHYLGHAYCKTIKGQPNAAGMKAAVKERDAWMLEATQGARRGTATFGAVAQQYLNQLDVKLSTRQTYRAILNGYWMPSLAALPIHTIRPSRIRETLAVLAITGKTKKNILIPLRGVFDLAVEEEWIDSNPVQAVRLKRHQKPPIERFTPKERAKILAKLDGQALLYFHIAFGGGLRPGEILGLNREDFDGTSLRVNKAIVRRRKTDTKTHEARTVHCSPELRQALCGDPARFQRGAMFLNSHGTRHMDTDEFNRAWRKALDAARVPYRIPYVCRHTRAAEMLMAGVEPAYAAKQLGHSLEMFFRTYAAWINTEQDAVEAAKLDAMGA